MDNLDYLKKLYAEWKQLNDAYHDAIRNGKKGDELNDLRAAIHCILVEIKAVQEDVVRTLRSSGDGRNRNRTL